MRETAAREKGDRRTPDFGQAIMLLRNVYNEIIVSGILRLGWCLKSYLCYQFYSTKGPAGPTAAGVSFMDENNVPRVRQRCVSRAHRPSVLTERTKGCNLWTRIRKSARILFGSAAEAISVLEIPSLKM